MQLMIETYVLSRLGCCISLWDSAGPPPDTYTSAPAKRVLESDLTFSLQCLFFWQDPPFRISLWGTVTMCRLKRLNGYLAQTGTSSLSRRQSQDLLKLRSSGVYVRLGDQVPMKLGTHLQNWTMYMYMCVLQYCIYTYAYVYMYIMCVYIYIYTSISIALSLSIYIYI